MSKKRFYYVALIDNKGQVFQGHLDTLPDIEEVRKEYLDRVWSTYTKTIQKQVEVKDMWTEVAVFWGNVDETVPPYVASGHEVHWFTDQRVAYDPRLPDTDSAINWLSEKFDEVHITKLSTSGKR